MELINGIAFLTLFDNVIFGNLFLPYIALLKFLGHTSPKILVKGL